MHDPDTPTPRNADTPSLIVVGSIGIDTIETPAARKDRILGGSASYACAAASFFTKPGLVGIVGTDFPPEYSDLYAEFGINTSGLQVVDGETFAWEGVYEENMDNRRTISTDLNVFADFSPELPEAYCSAPFVFLANIQPSLQSHVLDQVTKPRFVVADTMDLWIDTAKDDLLKMISRVDLLTLNESEARHLSGERILLRAARHLLDLGPKYVLIKKGEHGSVLFSRSGIFLMPAFPLDEVNDPTGAGDSFAGGFMGALAATGKLSDAAIRRAMVYGSVIAAFGCEDFSLGRLAAVTVPEDVVDLGLVAVHTIARNRAEEDPRVEPLAVGDALQLEREVGVLAFCLELTAAVLDVKPSLGRNAEGALHVGVGLPSGEVFTVEDLLRAQGLELDVAELELAGPEL